MVNYPCWRNRRPQSKGESMLAMRLGDDYLDSRELEERLTDLLAEGPGQDIDDIRERKIIRELRDGSGSEWRYGITFIREDSFEDYARELAEDVGAIDREAAWPACHIDWEAAADSLRMDYTSTTIDGVEYLYR